MKRSSIFLLLFTLILFVGIGIGAFYFYFYNGDTETIPAGQSIGEGILKSYTNLKIFYPVGGRVEIIEKQISSSLTPLEMAETLIEGYIKISREFDTGLLPSGTGLNNVFFTTEGIMYLDFTKALERNFQGDVIDEFILLKSIFDTIVSNIDVKDVVILVDGKVIESLGGHFIINQPLKKMLTQELRVEELKRDE